MIGKIKIKKKGWGAGLFCGWADADVLAVGPRDRTVGWRAREEGAREKSGIWMDIRPPGIEDRRKQLGKRKI